MSLKAKGINTVSQILTDLSNGLTRTPKDKHYDPEKGSIQEKYNLNFTELKVLFSHAQLKGKKTKVKQQEVVLDIEDDVTQAQETEVVDNNEQVEPIFEGI